MHKFVTALSVANTAFPTTPQFVLESAVRTKADPFTKYGLLLMWRSGVKIEYSFDGVTVHGDLEDVVASKALALDGVNIPLGAIWFRAASASTIRVEVFDQ